MIKRNRRQRFPIVDKSLQYRFLAMILIYGMIVIIFLFVFLFVPDIIQLQDESLSLDIRAAAADKILTLHARVWPTVITLMCVIGIHSFRVFHRFVGPLYRFRWAFEQVQNGNLGFRVKLRAKDYLRREEEALNEMIEMLAGKLRGIQLASLDAVKSLGKLEQKITKVSGLTKPDKELLRVHRQHLDTVIDAAGYFQLQESQQE
jgi:methyl-accepting chemotaxis protein